MAQIYFVGGEDSEFGEMAGGTVETTSGYFRPEYARCALVVTSNSVTGAINVQNTCRWRSYNGFAQKEFWMTARCRQNFTLRTHLNSVLKFVDATGTPRLQLRSSGDGQYVVETLDGTGAAVKIGNTAFFELSSTTIDKLDFHINYDVVGSIDIYLNGMLVFNFLGDCTTDSVVLLDKIDLMSPCNASSKTYWSEIFVADIDTRALSLETFAPVANGNANTFDTGSPSVSNINEITLDDTTLNGSSVAGQKDQYTTGGVATGTLDVIALIISARAQCGSSGPAKLAFGARTNGSDYWGADHALITSWENIQEVFPDNPNTGIPWLKSEIGAAVGFNIGSKSAA